MQEQELEFIELSCPYCKTGIDFLVGLTGTAQGCPNCGQSLVVPQIPGQVAQKVPLPMEGESITLRRLVPDDWKLLLDYWSEWTDEQLTEWLPEQAKQSIAVEKQVTNLGLQSKEDGSLIGNFMFQFEDPAHRTASFEIQANEAKMTDSLLRESCSALFVLCFGALNVHRITTTLPTEYAQQAHLMESIGMRREGHFRKDCFNGSEWHDTYLYAFLSEDYQQRLSSR